MFFRYFSRGFAAGLGFAVGFLLLTMLPGVLMNFASSPIRIDVPASTSSAPPPQPAVESAPESKPYSLMVGQRPELTIPEGGGIAFVAIVRDGARTPRPTSIQYWLTADEFWRIDTKDDQPTFSKLSYPAGDAAGAVERRLHAEVFGETGMTSSLDSADLARIDRGEQREGLNGVRMRNAGGVVWFLPNPR